MCSIANQRCCRTRNLQQGATHDYKAGAFLSARRALLCFRCWSSSEAFSVQTLSNPPFFFFFFSTSYERFLQTISKSHITQFQSHITQFKVHITQFKSHISQFQTHVTLFKSHKTQFKSHISKFQSHITHLKSHIIKFLSHFTQFKSHVGQFKFQTTNSYFRNYTLNTILSSFVFHSLSW